jgi:hypothetical protein
LFLELGLAVAAVGGYDAKEGVVGNDRGVIGADAADLLENFVFSCAECVGSLKGFLCIRGIGNSLLLRCVVNTSTLEEFPMSLSGGVDVGSRSVDGSLGLVNLVLDIGSVGGLSILEGLELN